MIAAITGASGFIGRHLCDRFARAGYDVRPVVRADYENGGLAERLRDADVVVHAAGATRAPTAQDLDRSNVDLTAATLRATRDGRFIFISSQAAAGPAAFRDKPVDEEMPPAPVDAYGRSKLAAENVVRASGIPFTIVRPAAVYGPGDRDFLPMFRLARLGLAIHPGTRDHWLSIAHVDDIVSGVLAAASGREVLGRTYFLGGEPRQWSELFTAAAEAANRRLVAQINVPSAIVGVAARVGDLAARVRGRAGLLTTEKVRLSKPSYWICSSERARRELGYVPAIALQQGLAATYHWYLDNHWL
jgi:nucleoside-diphosphate-sugar epimerase